MDRRVNWLDLPSHLLSLISDKLVCIKDYIQFSAVCRSWRSVYIGKIHCLPRQLPVLLLSTKGNRDYLRRQFYDLLDKRVYSFELPIRYNNHCRGSSVGWLVMVGLVMVGQSLGVHLFNPFLSAGNKIELPPLTAFELHEGNETGNGCFMYKAVLSTNPASNPNYVVMAIYSGFRKLACYKPSKNAWISLNSDCRLISDIIYYNDQFYAVDFYGAIWACCIDSLHPKATRVAPPIDNNFAGTRKYIVELFGELLQLRRRWESSLTDDNNRVYFTIKFEVFKLDQATLKWVETKSLCGGMLFVGDNTSMSLMASDYPGCKPNCIYFTEEGCTSYREYRHHGIGAYNLEDGSIEPPYLIDPKSIIFPSPIWVEPTLHGYRT